MLKRLLLALSLLFALAGPVEAQTAIPGLPAVSSPAPTDVFAGCPAGGTSGCSRKYTAHEIVVTGGGDCEIGNYCPADPTSTNYLKQSNALGTSPWTATNVTVAQSSLLGLGTTGTAWDLTSTATGGFIQQVLPLNSIPADTRTYFYVARFNKTRTTGSWTLNFFFAGDATNTAVYNPTTNTITSCVGGGTCNHATVHNNVSGQDEELVWIAKANIGATSGTFKLYPTGTLGATGTTTVNNVELDAYTGPAALSVPPCINTTTASAVTRSGVCRQTGASLTNDQTLAGVNTFSKNLIFSRYPLSGNPTMVFGGPTTPISPNNSFIEFNCKVEVSNVCAIVPIQSNQFATVAARQPDLIGWRAHCAPTVNSDGTLTIADWSTCAVPTGDAVLLAQGSAAEGYAPSSKSVTAAVVSAAGAGYTAGDVLTVSGGTVSTREGTNGVAAKITVDTVSSGAVATYHVSNIGAYVADIGFPLPVNPVAVTGGTGTGATFTLTFANHANATVGNLMLQADTACGAVSAWNVGGRWKFGLENPALGVAPNAMFYALDLRCTGATFAVPVLAPASTTTAAGLNLGVGVAPTSPANGDLWATSSGVYARIAGSTVGPFGSGGGGGGSGTVTSVAVTPANGVSGSVANATTTPAISLTLGAITPSSVAASGTVTGSNLSGTNTGDQTSVTGNAGTATALQTPRAINGVDFDGTAAITINAVDATARVPATRTISTTAPLAGGGDLSADRTLSITAATTGAAGSMSAADKTKLDAITGTNTGDQTTVSGQAGSVANAVTFDNSGSGAASGTTFNGSATRTISTNTIGALKASSNLSDVASVNTAASNLQAGYVVCQSAVAVSAPADTTEDTLDTCTIPANAVGANGRIVVDVQFTTTNSANSKTLKVKYGTTAYVSQPVTTSASEHLGTVISNRNSTSSQVGPAAGVSTSFGVTTVNVTTSAVDTTASSSITITCQKATSGETCTREAYQVLLYPKT